MTPASYASIGRAAASPPDGEYNGGKEWNGTDYNRLARSLPVATMLSQLPPRLHRKDGSVYATWTNGKVK